MTTNKTKNMNSLSYDEWITIGKAVALLLTNDPSTAHMEMEAFRSGFNAATKYKPIPQGNLEVEYDKLPYDE